MTSHVIKLVISGSMGAGKTTAIASISEIPPVCTDVAMSGEVGRGDKTTTTVAMDYGELTLEDGRKVALFGTPGQRRFDFMCKVLARGALGLIILIDQNGPDPTGELEYFLDLFGPLVAECGAIVGVTHADEVPSSSLHPYYSALKKRGLKAPVFAVDARRREDVIMLLEILMVNLQFTTQSVDSPSSV